MKQKEIFFALFVLIPLIFFFSCSEEKPKQIETEQQKEQKQAQEQQEEEAAPKDEKQEDTKVETEELGSVEAPNTQEAIVLFTSGNVEYKRGNNEEWQPLEIGQNIKSNYTIRTAKASYCEIQFGKSAMVKVQESTTLLLEQVKLEKETRSVKMDMKKGGILNRVEKLTQGEEFKVKTPSVVCGVRGTQFGVKTVDGSSTKVAVKEGSVSVQPGTVDTDELKEKAKGKHAKLEEAIELIEKSTSIVSDNQEINVDKETADQSDKAAQAVADAIEKTDEKTEETDSEKKEREEEEAEKVSQLVEEVMKKLEEKRIAPHQLDAQEEEELQQIDEMELLDYSISEAIRTTPSESSEKQEDKEKEKAEKEVAEAKEKKEEAKSFILDVHKVSLKVVPENARIILNGKERGSGSFSGIFSRGKELSFEINREGFKSHQLNITVNEKTAKRYKITLAPQKEQKAEQETEQKEQEADQKQTAQKQKEQEAEQETEQKEEEQKEEKSKEPVTKSVEIRTDPKDARIVFNGKSVGTGSFSDSFEVGEKLNFTVRKKSYHPKERSLTVTEELKNVEVKLERKEQKVLIRTEPNDAKIRINGEMVGVGSISTSYPDGRELSIIAAREGYEKRSISYTTRSEAGNKELSLDLEPLPLQFTAVLTQSKLIGDAITDGNAVFMADFSGNLFSVTPEGKKKWNLTTANERNENSSPALMNDGILFTGSNEIVYANATDGSVISKKSLSGDSAHLFGRRAVPFEDFILMPTNSAIRMLDPQSLESQKEITVPGGSRMTPAVWNGLIVTVNQQGKLYLFDPEKGSAETSISTSGVQPVALQPALKENKVVFSGRKGTVVCVDLSNKEILWEETLSGENVSVYSDPECSQDGVYIYAGQTLYALSIEDGSPLFAPIKNVTGPPLYRNGKLFYGTSEGGLTIADASSGEKVGSVAAKEVITTRPVFVSGRFIVGTEEGIAQIMNP